VTRRTISSGSRFEKLARYSRAVVDGDWIVVSGTVGVDPETGAMPPTAEQQARNIFTIIERALAEAGSSLQDVMRCGVFLTGAEHLQAVVAVLAEKFDRVQPANTTIICQLPIPDAFVEIEVMALRKAQHPV
jgi:enamine deaminase RidA (YjgF/YER057c/UK114 family)